jgi:signal transduction histidine kinase
MIQLNERITFLINNLLNLARIRSGRVRLEKQEADLVPSVRGLVERLRPQLEARGYVYTLKGLDAPCVGCWDVLAVEQVLANLLTNAIKYGDAKPIEVAVEQGPAIVRLIVVDHGAGIALPEQRRVFRPFERASNGQRQAQSHGLGLWIVRQLVEAHGGRVVLESGPGEGTVVTVTLPRRSPPRWVGLIGPTRRVYAPR